MRGLLSSDPYEINLGIGYRVLSLFKTIKLFYTPLLVLVIFWHSPSPVYGVQWEPFRPPSQPLPLISWVVGQQW